MGSAGPARGVGVAADSGLPEGVGLMGADEGLDEGVAPGSKGAEAAPAGGFEPPEVSQFLRTPTEVCVPAAPLRKNPLIRKRLVPASAAVCAIDALASKMDTLTVCEPPRRDACEQGKSTAVGAIACSSALAMADDVTPAAEQEVPLVVTPSKAVNTVGVESRRVAAARKNATLIIDEPDLKQAMDSPYRERWVGAMRDELASLIENEVFELCELPLGAAALTGRWNLKIKRGAKGGIERFKARYVVGGFEQIHGLDFHETWAPVGHYTTQRCLLVIYACENLESMHLDIKCAFQNGKWYDIVCVVQPGEVGDNSGRSGSFSAAARGHGLCIHRLPATPGLWAMW